MFPWSQRLCLRRGVVSARRQSQTTGADFTRPRAQKTRPPPAPQSRLALPTYPSAWIIRSAETSSSVKFMVFCNYSPSLNLNERASSGNSLINSSRSLSSHSQPVLRSSCAPFFCLQGMSVTCWYRIPGRQPPNRF